jgi:DNA polymerase I-like protein with 3'-5' exonuclease and polymerase domains
VRKTSLAIYQAKLWDGLYRLMKTVPDPDAEIAEMIVQEQGGKELYDRLYHQTAATLTGRWRAGVGYTDGKNTPFQSLAADGGKLALWNLLYAGFDVYVFIHDEILVQLPANNAEKQAREIEQIMVRSMEEVMGHDIPAASEYVVADCWTRS